MADAPTTSLEVAAMDIYRDWETRHDQLFMGYATDVDVRGLVRAILVLRGKIESEVS